MIGLLALVYLVVLLYAEFAGSYYLADSHPVISGILLIVAFLNIIVGGASALMNRNGES